MARRTRNEPQSAEAFEASLREVSVSHEFDPPLTVLATGLDQRPEWDADATRRALDSLRVGDICQPDPPELLMALPNTKTADARVVEQRLREVIPEATLGVANYQRCGTFEGLVERARAALLGVPQAARDPEIP